MTLSYSVIKADFHLCVVVVVVVVVVISPVRGGHQKVF